jgi:glycerol uptake facilitator-like aquaporin
LRACATAERLGTALLAAHFNPAMSLAFALQGKPRGFIPIYNVG